MKTGSQKTLAIAATASLVLCVGALFIQHLRHGWPFSLHHGLDAPASPSGVAHVAEGAAGSAHPRAPVELAESQTHAIGLRVETAQYETISQPVRAMATIVADESRVSHVHTRVSGWIERLHVQTTGERVRAGQPLAAIFSQELLSTQSEYLAARRGSAAGPRSAVLDGARARLRVLGMTDAEVRTIEDRGEAIRLVTVTAPRSGVVLRRGISVGTAVDPSTEIITIADLSRIWALAEIPESDIPRIQVGMSATLEFPASGLEPFDAQVEFLYPTLSERTRTLRVRFEADNRNGALRPGIYGTATFRVSPRRMLTVARDAIVDTGIEQHVFVVEGERRFVPRSVRLGTRFDERIEVLEGLHEGESVVASGVFLIDSESRLRASGGGSAHAHGSSEQGSRGVRNHRDPKPQPTQGQSAPPSAPSQSNPHQGH